MGKKIPTVEDYYHETTQRRFRGHTAKVLHKIQLCWHSRTYSISCLNSRWKIGSYIHVRAVNNVIWKILKKKVRWCLCRLFPDFSIFSDFLTINHFKIPISLRNHLLKYSNWLIRLNLTWLLISSTLGHTTWCISLLYHESKQRESISNEFFSASLHLDFLSISKGIIISRLLNLFQILYLDSYLNCLRLNWSKINDVRGSFTSEKLLRRSEIDWSEFYGQSKTLYYNMNNTQNGERA